MICRVAVEDEIARAIEAKAAAKGLSPETYLVEEIERIVLQVEADNARERRAEQTQQSERTASR